MATLGVPAAPTDRKGKELTSWNTLTNDEKIGYLLYRNESTRKQKWRTMHDWISLGPEGHLPVIDRAKAARVPPPQGPRVKLINRPPRPSAPPPTGSILSPRAPYVPDAHEISAAISGFGQIPTNWRFVKTLYERPHDPHDVDTKVCLYVEVGMNYIATDRVVVKQVDCTNSRAPTYTARKLQREFDVTVRLNAVCDNIPHSRAQSTDTINRRLFRIYSDYCSVSDLSKIMERYDPIVNKYTDGRLTRQIPEPFIWLIFLSLAEGIFVLNTGKFGKAERRAGRILDKTTTSGWQAVHHRDIKPQNIFLDAPVSRYPGYPKPLLGDYDLALEFGDQTKSDRRGRRVVVGTKGWMAPEVKTNRAHVDFDDRTDIWNVGLVIWELMHSSLGEASLEFLRESLSNAWTFNPGEDTFLNEDQWLGTWNGSYPTQLQNLVRQCLKTNLNERPDFLELRTRTSRWLNEQKRIKGNYKRTKDRLPPHLFLDFQDDEFGIGLPITPPSPPRPPHFPGPHPPPRGGGNNKRGRDEDDDDDDQDNPDDDDTPGPSRPPIYQQPQHKHRKADEVQPGPKDNNVDKSQDEETDYANRRTPTVRSNRRNNNGKGKAPATEGKTPVWNGIGKGKAPVR